VKTGGSLPFKRLAAHKRTGGSVRHLSPTFSPTLHRFTTMDATIVPKIVHGHSQSVFVLSADGSQLYLLDPTRPQTGEHPPPYAPPERERRLRTRASTVSSAVPRSPTRPLRPLLPLRGHSDAALGQSTEVDERTPLLPRDPPSRPRWRSIFRNNSEISQTPRRSGIAKYFATLGSAKHWGAAFHLLILNFPFVSRLHR
jgi:hypothetical protein